MKISIFGAVAGLKILAAEYSFAISDTHIERGKKEDSQRTILLVWASGILLRQQQPYSMMSFLVELLDLSRNKYMPAGRFSWKVSDKSVLSAYFFRTLPFKSSSSNSAG